MPIARRRRGGFTLVEILVTLCVLALGVLAQAWTTTLVTRLVARGGARTRAAAVASARLERLRALPCPTPGGSATTLGMAERWTALALAPGASEVTIEVAMPLRGRVVWYALRSVVRCA